MFYIKRLEICRAVIHILVTEAIQMKTLAGILSPGFRRVDSVRPDWGDLGDRAQVRISCVQKLRTSPGGQRKPANLGALDSNLSQGVLYSRFHLQSRIKLRYMKSEVFKLLLLFVCEDDSPVAEPHVVTCDLPLRGSAGQVCLHRTTRVGKRLKGKRRITAVC